MTSHVQEVISRTWCGRIPEQAVLLEERVYPADMMPDSALSYQVRARKCSFAMNCQLAGMRCSWSGINPNFDPF